MIYFLHFFFFNYHGVLVLWRRVIVCPGDGGGEAGAACHRARRLYRLQSRSRTVQTRNMVSEFKSVVTYQIHLRTYAIKYALS